MTIPLTHYIKIKNNFCIGYFGNNPQIITKLKEIRVAVEKQLSEIKIYIACNDEFTGERMINYSELGKKLKEFAGYREINDDGIEDLLKESFN